MPTEIKQMARTLWGFLNINRKSGQCKKRTALNGLACLHNHTDIPTTRSQVTALFPVTTSHSTKRTASIFTANYLSWEERKKERRRKKKLLLTLLLESRIIRHSTTDSLVAENRNATNDRIQLQFLANRKLRTEFKKNRTALQFWEDFRLLTFRLHDNNSQTVGRCTKFSTRCDDPMYLYVLGTWFTIQKSKSGNSVKSQQLVELRLINWTSGKQHRRRGATQAAC